MAAEISIHALLAESDGEINTRGCKKMISIHALLAESDCRKTRFLMIHQEFLSTLSLRRATCRYFSDNRTVNISIHALLAESDLCGFLRDNFHSISIHALLAESDLCFPVNHIKRLLISIHALLAESDLDIRGLNLDLTEFLSTLSLRRATTL